MISWKISRRALNLFICLIFWAVIHPHRAHAIIDTLQYTATVSATVSSESFTPPVLISPEDDSSTNNNIITFVFTRASSSHGIDSYDLYLDDIAHFNGINPNSGQTTSLYTSSISNNRLTIVSVNSLSDGYYTWKIVTHRASGQTHTTSSFIFLVDTQAPTIVLSNVDDNILGWNSGIFTSLPQTIAAKTVYVAQDSPLLVGSVETFANIKIDLVCPLNTSRCQNSQVIINSPNGSWSHRYHNLLLDTTYSVFISSSDSAGNTSSLPEFYLIYTRHPRLVTPTPATTITPIPTPTTTQTEVTATPTPPTHNLPPAFPSLPPEYPHSPSPPAKLSSVKMFTPNTDSLGTLAAISIIGHLLLSGLATSLKLSGIGKTILAIIIPPFFGDDLTLAVLPSSTIRTLPFTVLSVVSLEPIKTQLNNLKYISKDQLERLIATLNKNKLITLVTNSVGRFNLRLKPGHYLIIANKPGYSFPDQELQTYIETKSDYPTIIYHRETIGIKENTPSVDIKVNSSNGTWLIPLNRKRNDSLSTTERLQHHLSSIRIAPLAAAILLSIYALSYSTSYTLIIIFLLSIYLLLSEYIYPSLFTPVLRKRPI